MFRLLDDKTKFCFISTSLLNIFTFDVALTCNSFESSLREVITLSLSGFSVIFTSYCLFKLYVVKFILVFPFFKGVKYPFSTLK